MIKIERFNGREELDNLLKEFVSIPTNTEIIERTGFSKGAVSGIMNGKIKPSKSFIEAFKKGFKITEDKKLSPVNKETNLQSEDWFSLKAFNEHLLKEIEFLKEMLLKK